MKNHNRNKLSMQSIVIACTLMLISVAALGAWRYMPIYPDEVAFRLTSGRYIQDLGLSQNLFNICPSSARQTPILFVAPAWLLSTLNLHLSFANARILPFLTVLSAIFLSIWIAVKGRNSFASILATTALIGVSGSSLVIVRMEYIQILNVTCCLWAYYLKSDKLFPLKAYAISVLLLLSCLLSIFAHVQGLLFLPLTLYFVYHIVSAILGKVKVAIIITVLFIIVTRTAIKFHFRDCAEYPEVSRFISDMTFNLKGFESVKFTDWIFSYIDPYLRAFGYGNSYKINYLPGIYADRGWIQSLLVGLNKSIYFILIVNSIIFVYAAIYSLIFTVKQYVNRFMFRVQSGDEKEFLEESYAIILFSFPIIFLFFYDAVHNFYRSFFINLLVDIMVSIILSRIQLRRMRTIAIIYFIFCGVVVTVSIFVNTWWFTDKLRAGFEGPSISINKDWSGINSDVINIARDSGMDLSNGRIIVDDMTYESLNSYPILFPVTYLIQSIKLSGLTGLEVIKVVHPNYAIARCEYFSALGITPQKKHNQFCAVNFLGSEYSGILNK